MIRAAGEFASATMLPEDGVARPSWTPPQQQAIVPAAALDAHDPPHRHGGTHGRVGLIPIGDAAPLFAKAVDQAPRGWVQLITGVT